MQSKLVSGALRLLALLCIFSMVLLVPIKPALADEAYWSSAQIRGDDNNLYVVVGLYGKATTNSITITDITYWVCFYNSGGSNDNLNDFKLFLNGNQIGDTLNVKHGSAGNPASWLRDNGWSPVSSQDGDPYRDWYIKIVPINQTITGLNPSTAYVINSVSGSIDAYDDTIHKRKPVVLNSLYPTVSRDSYTEPVVPSISFTNIKDTSLKVVWSQNGNNAYTTFSLYRRPVGTSTWTTLFYDVADIYEFTDTGLNKESSYEYRLHVTNYHSGVDGTKTVEYDVYSTVSTTEDPAVAAAQEAASAAQVAKQSAELSKQAADIAASNSLQALGMASNASENALSAYNKAIEVKADTEYIKNNLIPRLENKIDNISQSVEASKTIQITSLKGVNGATCTSGSTFRLIVDTNGPPGEITATCNGGNVSIVGNEIAISDVNVPGAYTVNVTVKQGTYESKGTFVFFKI